LGNYGFDNLTAGASYAVTPTGSFSPSSQTLNSLTVNATADFKATSSIPSQCSTAGFAAATNFAAGPGTHSVAEADFNGDGKLDLAVGTVASQNVSILLGSGTGTFVAGGNFVAGSQAASAAVGDFNRDGKLDLAIANLGSNNVSILLGTGT